MIALILSLLPFAGPQERVVVREASPREPSKTEMRADTELGVHDARRLTGHDKLEALEQDLARIPAGEALEAFERIAATRTQAESTAKGLLEAVRSQIVPPLEPPERVELLGGGRLALLGRPAQHAWLAAFLEQAATFHGLIDLQARVYEVPRGDLPDDYAGQSGRALTAEAAGELIAWFARRKCEPTAAPRAVIFPFQEGRLAMVEEIPYVSDFEIKVIPGQADIADPVVKVAEHGTHLALRAVPVEGNRLVLFVELDNAHVRRLPIDSVEIEVMPGQHVTVQLPDITHVKIEGRFELGSGQSVLLIAPQDPEDKADTLVLLQARLVPAENAVR